MYALSDESRQQLLRLSLMIVCGGTAILPFTVPPTSPAARAQAAGRQAAISVPDIPGRLEFPTINVKRDPFVADDAAIPVEARDSGMVNASTREDAIGVVLPPNDGAQGAPASLSSTTTVPLVRGIVLGQAPQALVDFGNGVKVVGVGDSVGSETIRAIDASGITLSSGLRLKIASAPR